MVGGYELTKYLNGDELGKDYLANKLNSLFIIKRIDRNITGSNINSFICLKNAVLILREINHKNIAKFVSLFRTKRHFYIVKEYSNGGKLEENIEKYKIKYGKPFSEKISQHIIRQLVNALNYLHDKTKDKFDISLDNLYLNYHTEEAKNDLDILHSNLKLYLWTAKKQNDESDILTKTILCDPYQSIPDPLLKRLMSKLKKIFLK